ncbi:Zinc finger protein 862 [Dissostichus eleginoides]|uniref:Zinc finger protein 862 n=1 Tax=Dissostichus eleginoides TaxID=100907 RepID=A0AAD9C9J8_DISEL|nr:Zinc finger protein 862 [Dissostichus eleginoides]
MFADSDIAKTFACGDDKTAYITKFGLAPHIKRDLVSKINNGPFVLMFDESLNQTTKNKQLDLHVHFWEEEQVHSRYLGSQFMGHATAKDLLEQVKECVDQLELRSLVSISMDGPNVNWKFCELLQREHAELYGGAQLVVVGSCGLHTMHNAFKCGFTMWQLDKLLRAMHTLFHNVPARREDYSTVTKSTVFPLSFCGDRWVENLPVVERALAVWPSLLQYMDAVRTKKLPNPGTASFDTIAAALKDPLILAKLQYYKALARTFNPFLKKYQTDEPVMPFLGKHLAELIKEFRSLPGRASI